MTSLWSIRRSIKSLESKSFILSIKTPKSNPPLPFNNSPFTCAAATRDIPCSVLISSQQSFSVWLPLCWCPWTHLNTDGAAQRKRLGKTSHKVSFSQAEGKPKRRPFWISSIATPLTCGTPSRWTTNTFHPKGPTWRSVPSRRPHTQQSSLFACAR